MTPEVAAGLSALLAAVATVVGVVTPILFFSRGQPWGTIIDISILGSRLAVGDISVPAWNG